MAYSNFSLRMKAHPFPNVIGEEHIDKGMLYYVNKLHSFNTGSYDTTYNHIKYIYDHLKFCLLTWQEPNTIAEASIKRLLEDVCEEFDATIDKQLKDSGN